MNEENNDTLDDELAKIKQEMAEIKEILKNKEPVETEESDDRHSRRSRKHRFAREFQIKIDPDDFDVDVDMDGVSATLEDYVGNIMQGVQINLRNSMGQMSREFGNLKRESHHIRKEGQRIAREAQRAARRGRSKAGHVRYQPLSEEELVKFYELAPNLAGALSDERRLKILKKLETGPLYQGDLSDKVDIKGGALKHHLDALEEVKYIYQEQARGRYLITQLGVEAIKLAEMLFRRFYVESTRDDVEEIDDEDIDDEIDDLKDKIDDFNGSLENLEDKYDDALDDAKDSMDDLADDIEEKLEAEYEDDE